MWRGRWTYGQGGRGQDVKVVEDMGYQPRGNSGQVLNGLTAVGAAQAGPSGACLSVPPEPARGPRWRDPAGCQHASYTRGGRSPDSRATRRSPRLGWPPAPGGPLGSASPRVSPWSSPGRLRRQRDPHSSPHRPSKPARPGRPGGLPRGSWSVPADHRPPSGPRTPRTALAQGGRGHAGQIEEDHRGRSGASSAKRGTPLPGFAAAEALEEENGRWAVPTRRAAVTAEGTGSTRTRAQASARTPQRYRDR